VERPRIGIPAFRQRRGRPPGHRRERGRDIRSVDLRGRQALTGQTRLGHGGDAREGEVERNAGEEDVRPGSEPAAAVTLHFRGGKPPRRPTPPRRQRGLGELAWVGGLSKREVALCVDQNLRRVERAEKAPFGVQAGQEPGEGHNPAPHALHELGAVSVGQQRGQTVGQARRIRQTRHGIAEGPPDRRPTPASARDCRAMPGPPFAAPARRVPDRPPSASPGPRSGRVRRPYRDSGPPRGCTATGPAGRPLDRPHRRSGRRRAGTASAASSAARVRNRTRCSTAR
jgi:hypothetical protein